MMSHSKEAPRLVQILIQVLKKLSRDYQLFESVRTTLYLAILVDLQEDQEDLMGDLQNIFQIVPNALQFSVSQVIDFYFS